MARFAAGVVAGMAIMTIVGAALGIRASSSDQDLHEAAVAAGVDEQDLKGALVSLALAGKDVDPYGYLRSDGKLPPLASSASAPPAAPASGVWARLAQCESTGNWQSTSNPLYSGGLQFDAQTWARYGGLAFAPRAALATPAQQVIVAERTLAVQGWSAWPACSRRLGLR